MKKGFTYYPAFTAYGSTNAALLLSLLFHFRRSARAADGWSLAEIEAATGMKRTQQDTAKRQLKDVLQVTIKGFPRRMFFAVDWKQVATDMNGKVAGLKKPEAEQTRQQAINLVYEFFQVFRSEHAKVHPQNAYPAELKNLEAKERSHLKNLVGFITDRMQSRIYNDQQMATGLSMDEIVVQPDYDKRRKEIVVEADAVIEAFKNMLQLLPQWYKDNGFTATMIYSKRREIVQQIQANLKQSKQNGQAKQKRKSTADIIRQRTGQS